MSDGGYGFSVDADTGEFRVMVTGFADLPEDDEEYEEA